ncbi:hypothetical protein SAY87_028504 [Trapa incisa]|uniref:Uncharacterized protein n=2 Tax=Trapa TaxID=22665 RepID=A0AAN7L1X7_9MYRT|nr:hypothetical protein SAY87_028501 [Trapa incisa]KAK4773485.1 hypothetical protein SAY87_028504 [Trapa incisa]KAK4789465.1 hypothetical protein SAY86_016769 [Trapa natans]KAK4789656.1 hypothetical protein SAY86_016960 [Trapa natans]
MVGFQSILGLSLKGILHLPKYSRAAITSRKKNPGLLRHEESSRRALLVEAEEGDGRSIPKGHLAVYVGPEMRRFVIPASCLAETEFRVLMDTVGEEFGFEHEGGLHIPCEEADFEEILGRCLQMKRM